jgi:cytochrome c
MRRGATTHWLVALLAIAAVAGVIGAWTQTAADRRDLARRASAMTRGDPEHGRALAKMKGCAGCHQIPGVDGANGSVGPPLVSFSHRVYIGGVLSNTPDHLHQWLLDPPSIDPKTAMPNVGLNDREARDVAAFLYTLD